LIPALIISALFIVFEVVVYSAMIAVMPRVPTRLCLAKPRAGRKELVLVLAVTGWWFILWLWVPLYSDIAASHCHYPLPGHPGRERLPALWFGQSSWVVRSPRLITLAAIVSGLHFYARHEKNTLPSRVVFLRGMLDWSLWLSCC